MLRRYVTAVVNRPKLVIAAVMAVTLGLGFFISRLKVLLDVDAQIPPATRWSSSANASRSCSAAST